MHYFYKLSSALGSKAPDPPGAPSLDPSAWLSSPDP